MGLKVTSVGNFSQDFVQKRQRHPKHSRKVMRTWCLPAQNAHRFRPGVWGSGSGDLQESQISPAHILRPAIFCKTDPARALRAFRFMMNCKAFSFMVLAFLLN